MKKMGILNAQLTGYIVGLRHRERSLTGDTGMPVPEGILVADLVPCGGIPTLQQIVDAVLNETIVEDCTFAAEAEEKNPAMVVHVRGRLLGISKQAIPHDELKRQTGNTKLVVRTGEFTPYPNLVSQAGVAFPD